MARTAALALAALVALAAAPARALLVDDFEAGAFTLDGPTSASQSLPARTAAQMLGGSRTVTVSADVSASLALTGAEDRAILTFPGFPTNGGTVDFDYVLPAPLDLSLGQARAWLYADFDAV